MTLKDYKGAAVATTLFGPLTAAGTSFSVGLATGFPTGATPFVVAIRRGTTSEEKILCTRSGTVFTAVSRGYDDTVATDHPAGAAVEHVLDAASLAEASAHTNTTTRDDHTQYLNAVRHTLVSHDTLGLATQGELDAHNTGSGVHTGTFVLSAPTQAGSTAGGTPLRVFTLNPPPLAAPAGTKAPFTLELGGATFSGTDDSVLYGPGYNQKSGGGRVVTTEPSFGPVIEQDFNEAGFHWFEAYSEFTHPTGATRRPAFYGFDRATGSLIRTIHLAGTNGFSIQRENNGAEIFNLSDGALNMFGATDANVTLRAISGTPQFILQRDTTVVLSLLANALNQIQFSVGGGVVSNWIRSTTFHQFVFGSSNPWGIFTIDAAGTSATGNPILQTVSRATVVAGQDHYIAMNSAHTTITRIDRNGYFGTRLNVAPADADVATSEAMLWFDNTNGAGKLMVKAKTANGTVVTGSVVLA